MEGDEAGLESDTTTPAAALPEAATAEADTPHPALPEGTEPDAANPAAALPEAATAEAPTPHAALPEVEVDATLLEPQEDEPEEAAQDPYDALDEPVGEA